MIAQKNARKARTVYLSVLGKVFFQLFMTINPIFMDAHKHAVGFVDSFPRFINVFQ